MSRLVILSRLLVMTVHLSLRMIVKGLMRLHVPDWSLPFFAPLSRVVIDHIYANRLADHRTLSREEILSRLLTDAKVARYSSFVQFHPFVVLGKHREVGYSVEWFLELLSRHTPSKKAIWRSTLANWYQRNLIRYQAHATLDPESAAALFMARLLDRERKRDWLPPRLPKSEPRWYCWQQERPGDELLVTPVPIEPSLPKRGVLVSIWPGWDISWRRYERGAIRWRMSAFSPARGQYWEVGADELVAWDSAIHPYLQDLPVGSLDQGMAECIIEDAANMVLNRLAVRYFHEVIPSLEKQGVNHERSRISPRSR